MTKRTVRVMFVLLGTAVLLLAGCTTVHKGGEAADLPADVAASIHHYTLNDIEGTWTGDLVETGRRWTWTLQLTIRKCDVGEECGDYRSMLVERPGSAPFSPSLSSCEGTLTYLGTKGNAFMFEETIESGICVYALLSVVPMPGGYAIGVQEYWHGRWGAFGALLNEVDYSGYP
jgi:hypothetical protein